MRHLAAVFASLCLAAAALGSPPPAFGAVPPSNDNFADATLIGSLPYSGSVDASLATTEPGEVFYGSQTSRTVWYRYVSATDQALTIDMTGTDFSWASVSVFELAPWYSNWNNLYFRQAITSSSPGTVMVSAGTTLYFQVAAHMGEGPNLALNVRLYPPPPNDPFDGTAIDAIPYSAAYDFMGATREAGEPIASCNGGGPTLWWHYAAPSSAQLTAYVSDYGSSIAIWKGSSFADLTQLSCAAYGQPATFSAVAGSTYFFQIGTHYPLPRAGMFSVGPTPLPDVTIYPSPTDPSVFDEMSFYSMVNDPAGIGLVTQPAWDFGDGATAAGFWAYHRYADDGDYTVSVTVTTIDGRTRTATYLAAVRTHDVAITRFDVPTAAVSGQARTITVGISDHRYPETALVTLYRATTTSWGYWEQVATKSVPVAVRPAGRTTDARFTYTFSPADAALGKVSFRAVVTIAPARDAIPADNEMIATATRVTGK